MKINEVLNEAGVIRKIGTGLGKMVGGTAKAAGAVAGGIAGIPAAARSGFYSGKNVVSGEDNVETDAEPAQPKTPQSKVQQSPAFKPGAIDPNNKGVFASDVADAIRRGAGGNIEFKPATPTAAERAIAPAGTKIGIWSKTAQGWVNTTNNTLATSNEAAVLNKTWYKETQKQLRQQPTAQQPRAAAAARSTWDPKKKILVHQGMQYRKTAKGWVDVATDELIQPQYAGELNAAFDISTGRRPVASQPAQPQVQQKAAQRSSAQPLPDVSSLTPQQKAELIKRIKQRLGKQ